MAEWCVGKLLRSVAISRKSVIVWSFSTQTLLSGYCLEGWEFGENGRKTGVKA
jgi:hypothetical protein